ncbi:MAG: ubiquinone/menaquinone biosynthesis methyltransferase [Candidatus Thorarchaeota archaeon]|nr:ubiquinone/menaquinone biosynthesis methyltransferase [Candidatus Thorarchaeota archaeon]
MTARLQQVFSDIAQKYEQVNHVFTLGLDIIWRSLAVRIVKKLKLRGTWLDVCSGTGEMAALLQQIADRRTRVVTSDFSQDMLTASKNKEPSHRLQFILTDTRRLPFLDESVDLVTISFATRNLNNGPSELVSVFREFYRVLRPGGIFLNLETSQPSQPIIRESFHRYVDLAVNHLGPLLAGSKEGYSFLADTVQGFYDAETLSLLIRRAGFQSVWFKKIFFGVAAVHLATK